MAQSMNWQNISSFSQVTNEGQLTRSFKRGCYYSQKIVYGSPFYKRSLLKMTLLNAFAMAGSIGHAPQPVVEVYTMYSTSYVTEICTKQKQILLAW